MNYEGFNMATVVNSLNSTDRSALSADASGGLALKVYAETLNAFLKKNVFMELVSKRTISNGKSAQFILTGKLDETDVGSHVAGTEQAMGAYGVGETTIIVDDLAFIKRGVDAYEEKMDHYSIRNPLVTQMGQAMSQKVDKAVEVKLFEALSASAGIGQDVAGAVVEAAITGGATNEAKGDAILSAIFEANSILDGKDITGQRYFVTTNSNYYNLLQSQKAVNRDFNDGSNGSIMDGNVFRIGDTMVLRSNNIAGADIEGYVFTQDAIGMVELVGLQTDQWFDKDLRATKMVAEMGYGLGVLNPGTVVGITAS